MTELRPVSPTMFEAMNAMDMQLSRLGGLSYALWSIVHETQCIDHGEDDANSICTLVAEIEDKIKVVEDLQSETWKAFKAMKGAAA